MADTLYKETWNDLVLKYLKRISESGSGIPKVTTYADLPDASSVQGSLYYVTTSTGVWPINRHSKGLYYSNGVTWDYSGDYPVSSVFGRYGDVVAQNNDYTASQVTYDNTGANLSASNVQTAINEVQTNNPGIQFNKTPSTVMGTEGSLQWDPDAGTLAVGMPGGNVQVQIGQEMLVRCKRATGQTIVNGNVVYISGASGQRPEISLADADSYVQSFVLGVATEGIGTLGYVTLEGLVHNVNTYGMPEGAPIWLSSTAGAFTTTRPAAPATSVFLGYIVYSHATQGIIAVRPQVVPRIVGLSDVTISSLQNGQVISYDSTAGVWKNITVSSGTTDHSALSNLTYATSGHIGFQPATAYSGFAQITVGTTQPETPSTNDLWVDTN